jgi:ATP-binding cassette, subfamily F, member 3
VRLAALHGQLEAIGGYTAESRAARLLHGLGFAIGDERRPVSSYLRRLAHAPRLAQALMCRSDLLLLDEPTNHLDLDAVIWLEGWLKAYPGTLLLISHDRDFLDSTVERICHLERRGLKALHRQLFRLRAPARRAARAAAGRHERQQREVAHMRAFVDRFRAKASKARQAQSRSRPWSAWSSSRRPTWTRRSTFPSRAAASSRTRCCGWSRCMPAIAWMAASAACSRASA